MDKGLLEKNKVFGINILYIVSILPLIIFAFYKNGLVVYNNGDMSFFLTLQYLIIPIVIIILSYVFEIYYFLIIKKDKDYHNILNSLTPYINALCYLVCGPRDFLWITIPLIIILNIVLKFLDDKLSINQIALFKCLLVLILSIVGLYNNANYYELNNTIDLTIFDFFLGRGIGCIGTTSVLCCIVGYVVLLFNKYYKKEIPLLVLLGYAIVAIIIYFVGGLSFTEIVRRACCSGIVFAAVYVAPLSIATPIVKIGRIIYALLVGMISAILVNIACFYTGIYIVILAIGLLVPILNKFKFTFF